MHMHSASQDLLIVSASILISFALINIRYWLCHWARKERTKIVFIELMVHVNSMLFGVAIAMMVLNGGPESFSVIPQDGMSAAIMVLLISFTWVQWASIEASAHRKIATDHHFLKDLKKDLNAGSKED